MTYSLFCRGDRIRTCDHLVPNQARYRAALHPEKRTFPFCECKGTLFSSNMQIFLQLFDNSLFFEYFFQRLHSTFNLLFRMCGHKCKTYQRILWCTCRRYHRINEYTSIKSKFSHKECFINITHVQWYYWTFSITYFKTFFLKTLYILPQK